MKVLSFDCETSIGNTIHGPTFRDANNDVYTQIYSTHPDWVSVVHAPGGFKRQLHDGFVEQLYYADVLIGHNISFDLCYFWQTKEIKDFVLRGGKIWDTQVAEYLLTGQQHTFSSLAELQEKYLGHKVKPTRISCLFKRGVGADKIVDASKRCPKLLKLYEHYCKLDGSTPLLIFKKQYARARQENMLAIIELYNDYLLSIINMTCTGIKIDVTKTEKTLQEFNLKHLEYLEQAQEILSSVWIDSRLPKFNINSPDHKSAVLFGGKIKIEETIADGFYKNGNPKKKKMTTFVQVKGFGIDPCVSIASKKDGLWSTGDAIMKAIAETTENQQVKLYCECQKQSMMYKKAAKTYCQAFLDRSDENGVLYPNFNNTLTQTGRLSSSEPNMQNISKRNQFGKILHSLFVAPEGWVCVQVDFAQLEIWVLAWLSNDIQLIEDLLSGVDLHIKRLQYYNSDMSYEYLYKLIKEEGDEYWNKQRTYAKSVSYQMAYGAQPKSVVKTTGLDLAIVETIFKKEAETYPDTAALSETVRASAIATAKYSMSLDIPTSAKKGIAGNKILNNVELLPIFDKSGEVVYNKQEVRKVGYWQSITGKKYHFLDSGRIYRNNINRQFSFTQPKNYPMQGSAADIQGATTAALLKALLTRKDKIQMINEVHDSKWFYVREDVLDTVLPWLKNTIENVPKIMLERFNIDVPFKFPVDIEIGKDFGSMEKYNAPNSESIDKQRG